MKKLVILALLMGLFGYFESYAQTKHTCSRCNGNGKTVERCYAGCRNGTVYCTSCNYSGKINTTCSQCSGRGSVTKYRDKKCDYCNGRKYFDQQKQEPCGYCRNGQRPTTRWTTNRNGERVQQTEYVNCNVCRGSGTKTVSYKAACRYCGGRGVSGQETYSETCRNCSGSGQLSRNCSQCGGKGCYACPTCKGYANIEQKCSRCNGYGVIYTD